MTPITIAELIAALRACKDDDARVYFDFPSYQRPTTIASYRGYYDRPALGFEYGAWDQSDHQPGKFADALEQSLTRTYTGWKGGEYRYSGGDNLFVAKPGETSSVLVTGLLDEGYKATILTAYLPDFY